MPLHNPFKHHEQQPAHAQAGHTMSLYYVVYPNSAFNERGFREAFDHTYYQTEKGKTQLTLTFSALPAKVQQGYGAGGAHPDKFLTVTPRGAFDKNDKNLIQTAVTTAARQIGASSSPVSNYP